MDPVTEIINILVLGCMIHILVLIKIIEKVKMVILFEYFCDDCKEKFYLQSLKSIENIICPHCGERGQVIIYCKHSTDLENMKYDQLSRNLFPLSK